MTTSRPGRPARNVRHSRGSPRWGTNPQVVAIARHVLEVGRAQGARPIYVDPFTEPEFDRAIEAERCLDGSPGRDGYRDRWVADDACPRADHLLSGVADQMMGLLEGRLGPEASAFCAPANDHTALVNPPNAADDLDSGEAVKRAWRILERYHRVGWLGGGAVWVGFNLNQLQTLQLGGGVRSPLHRSIVRCIPDRRLPFVRHSSAGDDAGDDQPSHPMFFCLLPARDEIAAVAQVSLFRELAGELGEVW